jgi:hypothetical protein
MSKERELAELDREFSCAGSTMRPDTFAARRAEILARTPDEEAPEIVVHTPARLAAPPAEDQFVTRDVFAGVLERTGKAIRGAIDRSIDPLGTRLSNVEFKVAALAMAVARGDPAERKQLADVESLLQRIDALESRLKALEHE